MKKAEYNHVLFKNMDLIGLRRLYVFLNALSLSDMFYNGYLLHQQLFRGSCLDQLLPELQTDILS